MRRRVIQRLGKTYTVTEPEDGDELALRQSEECQLIGLQVEAILAAAKSVEPDIRLRALLGAAVYCGMRHHGLTADEIGDAFAFALERTCVALKTEVS